MQIWLNNELNNLEECFGKVPTDDDGTDFKHYRDFKWYERGKEERKMKFKMDSGHENEVILYRYMPITQFWQIYISKKFSLLNPNLWRDPLESPFFNARIQQNGGEIESPFKDRFFAQCFTLNDSSESMWKTYGNGEKLVRLRMNVGAVRRLIDFNQVNYKNQDFYLGRVVYLNFEDIKYLFENVYMPKKLTEYFDEEAQARTLLVKRYAYSFEKEIRLIYDAKDSFSTMRKKPVAIDLDIPDISELISEILLDPNLNDHEVDFYKGAWKLIPHEQIKKSNLYSKEDYQLKLG